MLCVLILYISGGTYSLKSTPKDRFFEVLFMAMLFTLRVIAINCWDEIAEEIFFEFCFHVWPRAQTLALRPISQYTTYLTATASLLIQFLIYPILFVCIADSGMTASSKMSNERPLQSLTNSKNWRGDYWQHLVSTELCNVPRSWRYTRCFAPCFWR